MYMIKILTRYTHIPYTTLFRSLGGKAYSRQEVVKLESENGLVKAVHTSKGKRIEGAVFISNITPDRTLELRSEEHTYELQSRGHLVCSLLITKKYRDKPLLHSE